MFSQAPFSSVPFSSELVAGGGTVYNVYITELIAGSGAVLAYKVFTGSVSEIISPATALMFGYVPQVFTGSISEIVSPAEDLIFASSPFVGGVIEELSSGGALTALYLQLDAPVLEAASESDEVSAIGSFSVLTTETASALASVNSLVIFNATTQETVHGYVVTDGKGIFNPSVAVTVNAGDTPSARFLWELINDYQPGVWATLSTGNSSSWDIINDSQTPNWVGVNTLQ